MAAGLRPDDAESLVEFEHFVRQQQAQQAEADSEPVSGTGARHDTEQTGEAETPPDAAQPRRTEQESGSVERGDHPQPRIYVRCLAAYTNGILHGRWIDANQDGETLRDEIDTMLTASPMAGAEEYAIHDYEDFLGYELGEYENLATVSRIARGIAEHGRAFALYAEWAGSDEEALGQFEDHYMGHWDSTADWVRSAGEDFEWERQLETLEIDLLIKPYVKIDYEAFARDMASQWHIVEAPDGVYVFAL